MAQYKNGDIVWVQASKRLGWWPARVEQQSKLPDDLKEATTDKTLCVVKFLNEDNYQIIEDRSIICTYNSGQKEEHISAGMKKYYEKKKVNESSSPFMKFPTDVKQAEYLTGGSPDIVDHERFQPKKSATPQSINYKHIFVDPKSKEVNKVKSPAKAASNTPRARANSHKDASQTTKVSHPRFQGQSDHEVRIRTQDNSPAASRSVGTSSPAVGVAGQSTAGYVCEICAFSTSRLNLMVMHRKSHLNGSVPAAGAASPATASKPPTKASAQKRPSPSSPAKKGAKASAPKRAKKMAPIKEESAPTDLFDQVKRNLEVKDGQESSPTTAKQNKATKAASATTTPSSAATPKRAARTPKTSKSPTTTKSPSAESKPVLVNPKKKWLKSSMQSKAEANPEVKIKLMADWSEEEEEAHQPQRPSEAAVKEAHENGSDQELTNSKVLQQRSDDEDSGKEMDTDDNGNPDKNGSESSAAAQEEAMAGISAEIDKLNADLDAAGQSSGKEIGNNQPEKVLTNGGNHVNGLDRTRPSKSEEEIRLDVASLLAETSVPVLPDIEGLKTVAAAGQNEVHIIEEDAGNGGGNILMQVEGGETYMVVWEPGDGSTNIQELLAEGVVGADGEGSGTQTLLIDPSSLQAGSDLENLFQMAVAAVAPPAAASAQLPPAPNEQSNPTTVTRERAKDPKSKRCTPNKSGGKAKMAVEDLMARHGTAVGRDLTADSLVWAQLNGTLFIPAAVLDSDHRFLTLVAFDVERPTNQRKFGRNKVIPVFKDDVNMELLTFGRTRNRKMDCVKMEKGYDHAHAFSQLRQGELAQLSARDYLRACFRSPVKLFAARYLTACSVDDDLLDLPEITMDSSVESGSEGDTVEESKEKLQLVEEMLDRHILTEECLSHLAAFSELPSERMSLYEERKWTQLSLGATCGILESSQQLYSRLANFLTDNVDKVRKLVEGHDHKRVFVLDVLLPEALRYGVQRLLNVSPQQAAHYVIYGIDKSQLVNHTRDC